MHPLFNKPVLGFFFHHTHPPPFPPPPPFPRSLLHPSPPSCGAKTVAPNVLRPLFVVRASDTMRFCSCVVATKKNKVFSRLIRLTVRTSKKFKINNFQTYILQAAIRPHGRTRVGLHCQIKQRTIARCAENEKKTTTKKQKKVNKNEGRNNVCHRGLFSMLVSTRLIISTNPPPPHTPQPIRSPPTCLVY